MLNVISLIAVLASALALVGYLHHRNLVYRAYCNGRKHGHEIGVKDTYHRYMTTSRSAFEDWCER